MSESNERTPDDDVNPTRPLTPGQVAHDVERDLAEDGDKGADGTDADIEETEGEER
jgi:hypothetical protein